MPLASLHAPFDHPDWIFEAKLDGFRALAYLGEWCGPGWCFRRGNAYKFFSELCTALAAALPVKIRLEAGLVH